jgi:(Z)-2-((N-methylformamido)methylene)-5-hydroxybutyrolactone dehydrogenase
MEEAMETTEDVRRYQMLIGGEWVDARSGASIDSVNPYTGKVWAAAPEAQGEDAAAAVAAAREAFDEGPWGTMTGRERSRLMHRLADLIEARAPEIARIESTDNGKLLREMNGQIAALPEWYRYFAGAADKIHGESIPTSKPNFFAYTRREPVGVCVGILPWNSPLLLLTWKLAPALAAGCVFIAKPAEQTPVSTLEFARLFEEAGFPPGVFNVVTGAADTGRALVRHPGVDKVAFTGSTETGKAVMRDAADHLARVSLELGGKSPNIVFDDADVDAATNGIIAGIFAATGQTCVAGSRLLVQEGIHDEVLGRVAERAKTIKLGDPLAEDTEMGPVAFSEQLDKIQEYISIGQGEGAQLVVGGVRPTTPELADGYFVEPTIFDAVTNDMRLAREEIFGPVLAVIPFKTEDEAVRLGNDSDFGLGSGVWTASGQRAHRVAHKLRAGTVWVNTYRTVSFDVPFGGYRQSGFGRENGLESLHEYTQVKSIWVELSGQTRDPFTLG